MPVRPRRQRRRSVEWSARIALALTIGQPAAGVSESALAAAWQQHSALLLDGYPDDKRPAGFWKFDPDVPDALRGEAHALYPLDDAEQHRAERADLELRRAAWLAEHTGA